MVKNWIFAPIKCLRWRIRCVIRKNILLSNNFCCSLRSVQRMPLKSKNSRFLDGFPSYTNLRIRDRAAVDDIYIRLHGKTKGTSITILSSVWLETREKGSKPWWSADQGSVRQTAGVGQQTTSLTLVIGLNIQNVCKCVKLQGRREHVDADDLMIHADAAVEQFTRLTIAEGSNTKKNRWIICKQGSVRFSQLFLQYISADLFTIMTVLYGLRPGP